MATNIDFARVAQQEAKKYHSYEKIDCQGLVKHCLKLLKVSDMGYRGSNDMIRHMTQDVKPISASPEVGSLVYMVRYDNCEPERYKKGGEGYAKDFDGWNAHHIGIYIGDGKVAESAMSIGKTSITDFNARKPKWAHTGRAKQMVA